MTRVVIHEQALRRFMHSEEGPVGRHIARKAAEITTYAGNNLSAHTRSGDAIAALRFAGMFDGLESIYALVGTDAKHDGFNYPLALELGGTTPQGRSYQYPFLIPAVEQAGFRKRR